MSKIKTEFIEPTDDLCFNSLDTPFRPFRFVLSSYFSKLYFRENFAKIPAKLISILLIRFVISFRRNIWVFSPN